MIDKGFGDSYVEISGTSKINDSQELKIKLWDKSFENWFEGPERSKLFIPSN